MDKTSLCQHNNRVYTRLGPASISRVDGAMLADWRMAFESDKTMFEIYREKTYTGQFRVVYFTELQDHNKESEINHAMSGEHLFDGFLKNYGKEEAKEIIESLLHRMNAGESVSPADIIDALGEHLSS